MSVKALAAQRALQGMRFGISPPGGMTVRSWWDNELADRAERVSGVVEVVLRCEGRGYELLRRLF